MVGVCGLCHPRLVVTVQAPEEWDPSPPFSPLLPPDFQPRVTAM